MWYAEAWQLTLLGALLLDLLAGLTALGGFLRHDEGLLDLVC